LGASGTSEDLDDLALSDPVEEQVARVPAGLLDVVSERIRDPSRRRRNAVLGFRLMHVDHGNLSDPDYEPTDEELQGLVQRAFSDVPSQNQEALRKVHGEIAVLRAELLRQWLKLSTEPAA
jgi:hypothetical protein